MNRTTLVLVAALLALSLLVGARGASARMDTDGLGWARRCYDAVWC